MEDPPEVDEIVILAPVTAEHTSRSVRITAGCGHAAWIGPSSLFRLLNVPKVITVCMDCVDVALWLSGDVGVVPGVEEELAAHWKEQRRGDST